MVSSHRRATDTTSEELPCGVQSTARKTPEFVLIQVLVQNLIRGLLTWALDLLLSGVHSLPLGEGNKG